MPGFTRDFSKKREPIYFTVDGERFDCQKALPLEAIAKVLGGLNVLQSSTTDDEGKVDATKLSEIFDKITPIIKVLLKKASFKRFMERFKPELDDEGNILNEDDWEPIDHEQLTEIITWVVEVYTKGRSPSSAASSSGSKTDDDASSSTAGAPLATSTPVTLTPTDALA